MRENPKNRGSLGGEMRMRVKAHCRNLSNHTKSNYMHAIKSFDSWRKDAGLSNKYVRDNPRDAVVQWAEHLRQAGIAQSTIHTMVAGACCGMGIPSNGIVKHGTAMDKTKSMGRSERAQAAREKKSNEDIVRFQAMVGGRRAALSRLTGKCFVYDESGSIMLSSCRSTASRTPHCTPASYAYRSRSSIMPTNTLVISSGLARWCRCSCWYSVSISRWMDSAVSG